MALRELVQMQMLVLVEFGMLVATVLEGIRVDLIPTSNRSINSFCCNNSNSCFYTFSSSNIKFWVKVLVFTRG